MVDGDKFSKTICSICYEDLKPVAEDLQAIFICGHVFHELCLQQWFEYCSSSKKCTCPVCKQKCKTSDVSRLYFQSIGDSDDRSSTQKPIFNGEEEDPKELRREVRRLESKVEGLCSTLERQGKDLKEITEELFICKEQERKEVALKNEALKKNVSLQQLLRIKSEELNKSALECLRLQERNMALAKELAALKLVSDLNLDEEEVLKLASFGNGANTKDAVDTLRRSLVMRNKSYKELMAKCNLLGREESRSSKKLDKAKEKINKLKARVKELEIAVEDKDNEALRELKSLKKAHCEWDIPTDEKFVSNSYANSNAPKDQNKGDYDPKLNLEPLGSLANDLLRPRKAQNCNSTNEFEVNCNQGDSSTMTCNKGKDACLEIGKEASKYSRATNGVSNATSNLQKETSVRDSSNLVGHLGSKTVIKTFAADFDDNVILLDDVTQVEPVINIRKESSFSQPHSVPGDVCFSGGLLGPDGTNRYLGKWCKRGQSNEVAQGGSVNSGNLISVGADGRGGRVKVLRSLNQSSMDFKETSVGAKRFKSGGKTNGMQSRGCLQIEHFFSKVGN